METRGPPSAPSGHAWLRTGKPRQMLRFPTRRSKPGRCGIRWREAHQAVGSRPHPPCGCLEAPAAKVRLGDGACFCLEPLGAAVVFHSEGTSFLVAAFRGALGNLGFLCLIRNGLQGAGGAVNREHGGAVRFSLCSLGQMDFRGEKALGFSRVGG